MKELFRLFSNLTHFFFEERMPGQHEAPPEWNSDLPKPTEVFKDRNPNKPKAKNDDWNSDLPRPTTVFADKKPAELNLDALTLGGKNKPKEANRPAGIDREALAQSLALGKAAKEMALGTIVGKGADIRKMADVGLQGSAQTDRSLETQQSEKTEMGTVKQEVPLSMRGRNERKEYSREELTKAMTTLVATIVDLGPNSNYDKPKSAEASESSMEQSGEIQWKLTIKKEVRNALNKALNQLPDLKIILAGIIERRGNESAIRGIARDVMDQLRSKNPSNPKLLAMLAGPGYVAEASTAPSEDTK